MRHDLASPTLHNVAETTLRARGRLGAAAGAVLVAATLAAGEHDGDISLGNSLQCTARYSVCAFGVESTSLFDSGFGGLAYRLATAADELAPDHRAWEFVLCAGDELMHDLVTWTQVVAPGPWDVPLPELADGGLGMDMSTLEATDGSWGVGGAMGRGLRLVRSKGWSTSPASLAPSLYAPEVPAPSVGVTLALVACCALAGRPGRELY